jgi:nucleotide-binding universal stress UspA family protein
LAVREAGNHAGVTHVLIAVDETEAAVHAAEVARQLFGDDAEYSAVSVADVELGAESVPWWGNVWGSTYPVPYGAAWPLPGIAAREVAATSAPPRDDLNAESPADAAMRAASDTARAVTEETGLTSAEPVAEVGEPTEAILRAAEERDVDVVVVGSHEHGWFDRLLGGSVEKQLLKRSAVPVLVVRR